MPRKSHDFPYLESDTMSSVHSSKIFHSNQSSSSSIGLSKGASVFSLLSVEELKSLHERYVEKIKIFEMENALLEKHVAKLQPDNSIGSKVSLDMDAAKRMQRFNTKLSISGTTEMVSHEKVNESKLTLSGRSTLTTLNTSGTRSTLRSSGHVSAKLNHSFLIELIAQQLEDMKTQMGEFLQYCKTYKFKTSTQTDERIEAIADVKATRAYLEQNFSNNEAYANRALVSAEKYLNHFTNVLNSSDQKLSKMKLKCSTLHTAFNRLKSKLERTIELGETIYPIDIDELRMENKSSSSILEAKNKCLLELKKVTGRYNLDLNSKNRYLGDLRKRLCAIHDEIKERKNYTATHASGISKTLKEISRAQKENNSIKHLVTGYSAPSILDYAKAKASLREVKKGLKIGNRRINFQNTTIHLLKHKLKSNLKSGDISVEAIDKRLKLFVGNESMKKIPYCDLSNYELNQAQKINRNKN